MRGKVKEGDQSQPESEKRSVPSLDIAFVATDWNSDVVPVVFTT